MFRHISKYICGKQFVTESQTCPIDHAFLLIDHAFLLNKQLTLPAKTQMLLKNTIKLVSILSLQFAIPII